VFVTPGHGPPMLQFAFRAIDITVVALLLTVLT
jgi:hypothetical protein